MMYSCLFRTVFRQSRTQFLRLWLLITAAAAAAILFLLFSQYYRHIFFEQVVAYKSSLLHSAEPLATKTGKVAANVRQRSTDQKCVHPILNPYDPAIMQYQEKVPALECSSVKDWVYVNNGTFYISAEATSKYGSITCEYKPVVRDGDFSIGYGPPIKPMMNGTRLQSDFFRAHCKSESGKEHTNVHAAVAMNNASMMRLRKYHASVKSLDTFSKQSDHESSTFRNLNLSVLMLGFDSLSRMAWRRNLPHTHKYLIDTLGAIELEGYNILGDGTPAALLPILTGKMEEELPEARRGYKGAKPVDGHPWIWKEFSKHGYVTGYAEDMPSIGTFHYRMLGFQSPPTDHFMRPFYLAAQTSNLNNRYLCWGSKPKHTNYLNWFGSLLDMYRDFPKFFCGFYSEMSHDFNNRAQAMDDDLVAFLQELETKGHLDSMLLILMADHGARYAHIRSTTHGKLEERLPYFSFRFPPWFQKIHPTIVNNVQVNARRLTTPFDIHATFSHILNYSSTSHADLSNRAISLFTEIPKERTCTDAEITPHWCACLNWQPLDQSDPLIVQAVATAIQSINSYTQSHRPKCAELTLHSVTKSLHYSPSSLDRSAEWKLLEYAKSPPPAVTELFQVSFKTVPGEGHFEVTCKFDVKSRKFRVESKEISRINKYGSQPACIQKSRPDLRPYCYCV